MTDCRLILLDHTTKCVRSHQKDAPAPALSYMFLIWLGWKKPRNAKMPFKYHTVEVDKFTVSCKNPKIILQEYMDFPPLKFENHCKSGFSDSPRTSE